MARRVDWGHIIAALRTLALDDLRTRLRDWGCPASMADEAVPVAFVWLPAGHVDVPAGLLQAGDWWVIVYASGPIGGPYRFVVMVRRQRPENDHIGEWSSFLRQ